jgi:uncharacterized protein with beta-barrel porin domain
MRDAFFTPGMRAMDSGQAFQSDLLAYAHAQGGASEITNGLWVRPIFWYTRNDKDGSHPSSEITGFGFITGYDVSFGPATLGASYGYSHASLDMTRVDGDMDSHTVGLYGSLKLPMDLLFKAWGGHTWNNYDITRTSSGLNTLAGGDYNRDSDGSTWTAMGQLSRAFALNENVSLTPFAGVNVAWIREDGYTERAEGNAAPALAIQYDDYSDTTVHSQLGAELEYAVDNWAVRGRAAWNARLTGDKRASRDYRLQGVDWQESLGYQADNHTATVGLAGWYNLPNTDTLSIYGGYDANLGKRTQTHTLTVGLRLEF